MVDAAASLRAMPHSGSKRAETGAARVHVTVGGEAEFTRYAELAAHVISAPAQSPTWISQWIANTRPDGIVATATRGG